MLCYGTKRIRLEKAHSQARRIGGNAQNEEPGLEIIATKRQAGSHQIESLLDMLKVDITLRAQIGLIAKYGKHHVFFCRSGTIRPEDDCCLTKPYPMSRVGKEATKCRTCIERNLLGKGCVVPLLFTIRFERIQVEGDEGSPSRLGTWNTCNLRKKTCYRSILPRYRALAKHGILARNRAVRHPCVTNSLALVYALSIPLESKDRKAPSSRKIVFALLINIVETVFALEESAYRSSADIIAFCQDVIVQLSRASAFFRTAFLVKAKQICSIVAKKKG